MGVNRPHIWDGLDWQRYVVDLLALHFGPSDFCRIPDEYQGDLGLEAFTRSGVGIQCYCPREPISIKKRYEQHRKKLSTDIRKLIRNGPKLEPLLGGTKLGRWYFMIPSHDNKELIAHGNVKAREVRAKNLPYITSQFEIQIHDDSSFPTERNRLFGTGGAFLPISRAEADGQSVQDWADANDQLVQVVDKKLQRVQTLHSSKLRRKFRNELIAKSIQGQNVLEQVRSISADVYEKIVDLKSARAADLAMQSLVSATKPHDRLNAALSQYVDDLRSQINVLPRHAEVTLGWEAVSDWLYSCPLDFPGGSNE
jgi:hypothetical protein